MTEWGGKKEFVCKRQRVREMQDEEEGWGAELEMLLYLRYEFKL